MSEWNIHAPSMFGIPLIRGSHLRADMPTVVRGSIPAEDLVLHHTLETIPDLEVECEQIISSGQQRMIPLVRMRYADREAVEAALEADPTVRSATCLFAVEDECLYRMEWGENVQLVLEMLTNGQATVLDAHARDGRWRFRLLYPDRDHFSQTYEFADEHGVTLDISSIRDVDDDPSGPSGLTEPQYEALALAVRSGYYEVPKRTSLEEMADTLGVSHQALSERLRRATGELVKDALGIEAIPEMETESSERERLPVEA